MTDRSSTVDRQVKVLIAGAQAAAHNHRLAMSVLRRRALLGNVQAMMLWFKERKKLERWE
jgi:hypothetical protein